MTRIFQIKNYDGKLPFFWKKKPTVQQKRNFRVNMYLSFEYKNTLCRIVMFWIEFNLWQTHFRCDCSLHQLYQNCSLFMQIKNPQRIDPGIGQRCSFPSGMSAACQALDVVSHYTSIHSKARGWCPDRKLNEINSTGLLIKMCELLQSTKDVLLLSIVIKADVTLMHSLLTGGE